MPYTTTTLTDALTLLAERLMDPDRVHWVNAELTLYIQESIRQWNALTGYYRDQGSFVTTVNEAFYDIRTLFPSTCAYTFTTDRAIGLVCYALLEPLPSGSAWNGSNQFTLEQVVAAIQEARDRFLMETGVVLTRSQPTVSPVPSNGRIALDQAIQNLRRVAWRDASGFISIVRRDDEWSLSNYAARTWQTPRNAPPKVYTVGQTPPLVMQVAPVPSADATLDLLTVNIGADVDAAADAALGVPDDWAWVVIYGALAILLGRDGLARDPSRATYCNSRWQDGVGRAKALAACLDATIDGEPASLGAVSDADFFASTWQVISSIPQRVLTAGQNIVAVCPAPGVPVGGGGFDVSIDFVRNAPIPTSGGDFLQVGAELLEAILDYAQYQALFKEGASAIQTAQHLLDRFYALAGTSVNIQWASSPNRVSTTEQTVQDARSVAYETTDAGTIN